MISFGGAFLQIYKFRCIFVCTKGGIDLDKRDFGLDFIRAVAILLVIVQHAWSILGLDEPAPHFSYYGYKALIYGVPLFVMLSGFLQLRHPLPPATFLKKRLSRILWPFLLWAFLVYVVSVLTHRYPEVTDWREAVLQFLPRLLTNRINTAYWFVFMLIGLYLVTPVLQAALQAAADRKRLLEYCLVVWVALMALQDLYPACALLPFFPVAGKYLGYYLLGCYLCEQAGQRTVNLKIGALGFPLAYGLNAWMMACGHDFLTLEILEVICLFLLLKSVRMPAPPVRLRIERVSRYSYTIYLTHFVLIAFFYRVFPGFFPPHWATPLYTSLLVLAIEYLFCFILERLRFIPSRLTGIV